MSPASMRLSGRSPKPWDRESVPQGEGRASRGCPGGGGLREPVRLSDRFGQPRVADLAWRVSLDGWGMPPLLWGFGNLSDSRTGFGRVAPEGSDSCCTHEVLSP